MSWFAVGLLALGSGTGCAAPNRGSSGPVKVTTPTTIVSPHGVEDLEELLRRADRELLAQRYLEAARLYQRAVDNDAVGTYRGEALWGLGSALDQGGEPQQALRAYERLRGLQRAGRDRDTIGIRVVRLLTYLERYEEAEIQARHIDATGRAPLEQVALLAARALGALQRGADEDAERDLIQAHEVLDPLGIEHLDRVPLDVAAWSFARGELARRKAGRIGFVPLPSDFAETLERRCVLLLQAQSAYSDAMRAHSAHYSAMAGVRVGQLYQELHHELMRMPPPPAAQTRAQTQLVEGALRLRYAVLLDTAATMLSATLQMVERSGEGRAWAERAEASLDELRRARVEEERALAALPYSRAELEKALRDLSSRSP